VRDLLWAALTLVAAYALCAAVFGAAAQGAPLASPTQATPDFQATATAFAVSARATMTALRAERDMWLAEANWQHQLADTYTRKYMACRDSLAMCRSERLALPLGVRGR